MSLTGVAVIMTCHNPGKYIDDTSHFFMALVNDPFRSMKNLKSILQ